MRINEEAQRLLVNLDQHYDVWRNASRTLAEGRLQWKRIDNKEYLYRIVDSAGNGRSLGPRAPDTEHLYEEFLRLRQTQEDVAETLRVDAALYRALRLPRLPSFAGDVVRELDLRSLLGTSFLVVGTNALLAYAMEALELFPPGMDTTDDFDLTWVEPVYGDAAVPPRPNALFAALKRIDGTYAINTERQFQIRNSKGNEVELLLAAAISDRWSNEQRIRPVPLPEQDWLLKGRPVSQIATDYSDKPARVCAPDPRWFGLHKLWLSQKPGRDHRKVDKDERQGRAVLDMVADHMPHYPLDTDFRADVPQELRPYLENWERTRNEPPSVPRAEK
jgi:hypothetical protein